MSQSLKNPVSFFLNPSLVLMQSNYAYHSLQMAWQYYKTFSFSISGFALRDYEDPLSQNIPRIITRGETIRAAFGERVQLPCHVQDLGKFEISALSTAVCGLINIT